jgi:hypothetical protein
MSSTAYNRAASRPEGTGVTNQRRPGRRVGLGSLGGGPGPDGGFGEVQDLLEVIDNVQTQGQNVRQGLLVEQVGEVARGDQELHRRRRD